MRNYISNAYNLNKTRYLRLGKNVKEAVLQNYIRPVEIRNIIEQKIIQNAGSKVLYFILQHLNLKKNAGEVLLTTDSCSYFDVEAVAPTSININRFRKSPLIHDHSRKSPDLWAQTSSEQQSTDATSNLHAVINLRMANIIKNPDELFRSVNRLLPYNGIFIGRVRTYGNRKGLFFRKYGMIAGEIIWLADFFFNRIPSRLPYIDKLHNYLTGSGYRALSQAEILGRLAYCGFDIKEFKTIGDFSYFIVRKVRKPETEPAPSYYPLIKLGRIGQGGNIMKIYKVRTMHPYSEYIQDYVVRLNGYDKKGRPANDFRLTRWGAFMRNTRLDELPQIINILKGDLKILGLRPLSPVRFNDYPEDLRQERIKYRPGCIPPYVALNMPGDRDSIEAERIYINDYKKSPVITDFIYLLKALLNLAIPFTPAPRPRRI